MAVSNWVNIFLKYKKSIYVNIRNKWHNIQNRRALYHIVPFIITLFFVALLRQKVQITYASQFPGKMVNNFPGFGK